MKTEMEALLYKEATPTSGGGIEQRLRVVDSSAGGGGPVLDSYNTTSPSAAATMAKSWMGEKISRGYREEMEHFCYCLRAGKKNELRCSGRVAMADAIMALTANLAMKLKKRIEFREEWFDAASDAVPETDAQVTG
jgi:hypothetical protein